MVSELRRRGEAAPSPRRVRPLPRQAVSSAAAAVGKVPTARWLGQKQGGTAKNFRPWLQGSQPGAFCFFGRGRQSLPLEGKVPNEVRRMRWNANHDGAPIACGGMNAGAFHHGRGLAAKARCHLIRRWRDSFPSRGSQRRGRKRNLRKKPTHKRQKQPSFQTIPNRNERIL